ncbi:unnamed protein product, partial [Sphagnum tenellum]
MIVVDLFCGVGGLSLGLQEAGFDIVAAYDFWDKAVETYNKNFNHPAFQFDLSDHEKAATLVAEYKPDVIVGGPPYIAHGFIVHNCQEFSSAGTRTEGAKANLTASFAKTVTAVKPTWFIMENVERATLSKAYQEARKIFKDAGYGLSENVLDASLCGVPQKRKRFFCIGKLDEADNFLDADIANGLSKTPMTIRDYFGSSLTFNDYYRHPRSYARRGVFSVDEPSPTIRGVNRPISESYVRHAGDTADPTTVKPMSFEDRAKVQTFPDDYKWSGTKTAKEQMIGNAVPVKLGAYVGNVIANY